jgi:signal transduction histidine kinase
MNSLILWVRAASVTLLFFELVLLAIRFTHAPSKLELFWFGCTLILVAAAGFLPSGAMTVGTYTLAVLWTVGMYACFLTVERKPWVWHAAVGVALLVLLLVRAIGLSRTLPFYLLFSFLLTLLAVYPLILLTGICRVNRHPLLYLYTMATAFQLTALVYDYLSIGSGLPMFRLRVFSGLFYSIACGFLLSEEAYLQGTGWQSLHIRLGVQEKRLRQAHSRLIQTENTLLLQDRLIVTGILTAGAAHEFKNTLALIQTNAGFALRRRDEPSMHQALHLIMEQAQFGGKAVTELLDQLIKQGRERAGTVTLKSDLGLLFKMIRTSCRREGINLNVDIPDRMRVTARRGELEQVLLNLVRNAMDTITGQSGLSERKVEIRSYIADGQAVIDIRDSGGGIAAELQSRAFDLNVSGKQSTGLGLFLAKTLVERNGGSLIYVPVEGGSCFRILLSCA